MHSDDDMVAIRVVSEVRLKATEALIRAQAALLDAQLEVKKWEEFLREYQQSSD